MTIGEKIAFARKKKGWTQTKLAEELGVSSEAVSKWERGFYLPDEYNEERLTDLLGLNYMDDDGNPVNGRLFNEDHMSSYLNGKLNAKGFSKRQPGSRLCKREQELLTKFGETFGKADR